MSGRLALAGVLLLTSTAFSQQTNLYQDVAFRVVTDIYFGDEKAPAQQTKTLFRGGVAYDISLADAGQITMVDPARDRIVLLNADRKVKTEVDLQELRQFLDAALKQAENTALAAYLHGAQQVENDGEQVQVGDSTLMYTASLQSPRDERMAEFYAQVADALAHLNGWRSGYPPFARLTLNRAIADRQALPEEIVRTTANDRQSVEVRCRLHTNWRLSKDDDQQIANIGTMLVTFKAVSAPEFFASPAATASKENESNQ